MLLLLRQAGCIPGTKGESWGEYLGAVALRAALNFTRPNGQARQRMSNCRYCTYSVSEDTRI